MNFTASCWVAKKDIVREPIRYQSSQPASQLTYTFVQIHLTICKHRPLKAGSVDQKFYNFWLLEREPSLKLASERCRLRLSRRSLSRKVNYLSSSPSSFIFVCLFPRIVDIYLQKFNLKTSTWAAALVVKQLKLIRWPRNEKQINRLVHACWRPVAVAQIFKSSFSARRGPLTDEMCSSDVLGDLRRP